MPRTLDAVLIDTSVASLLHKKKGGKAADWYRGLLEFKTAVVSFQTVAELLFWAIANRWGRRKRLALQAFIKRFVVISCSPRMAKTWANVMSHCQKRGRRLEAGDAWILAAAVHRQIPLVTHDVDLLDLEIRSLDVF